MKSVNFYAAARHNYELIVIASQSKEFIKDPERFV